MTRRWEVTENEVPALMLRGKVAVDMFFSFVAQELKDQLGRHSPRDEGELAGGWEVQRLGNNSYQVETDVEHADWVYKGTGLYRGRGRIKPKSAGALVFFWKRIGRMTVWKADPGVGFARWAIARGLDPMAMWPKGQPAQDFVSPAIMETEMELEDLKDEAFRIARAT